MRHPIREALQFARQARKIVQKVPPILREHKKTVSGDVPRRKVQGEVYFAVGAVGFLRELERDLREMLRGLGRRRQNIPRRPQ